MIYFVRKVAFLNSTINSTSWLLYTIIVPYTPVDLITIIINKLVRRAVTLTHASALPSTVASPHNPPNSLTPEMMMKLITLAAMAATASAQMCADSPPSTCRMLCASPVCSTGMCVMRTGSCCDLACIADGASAPSATTSCPDQDGNGVIDVSVSSHC